MGPRLKGDVMTLATLIAKAMALSDEDFRRLIRPPSARCMEEGNQQEETKRMKRKRRKQRPRYAMATMTTTYAKALRVRVDLLQDGPMAASAAACLMHLKQAHVPTLNCMRQGRTSLHAQILRGNAEVCIEILKRPDFTRVNEVDRRGSTALHHAACKDYAEVVAVLLLRDDFEGVNVPNENGWTALHFAADRGHIRTCTELMLHSDLNLNYRSKFGWTALHRAAHSGHEEVCRHLMARRDFVEVEAIVYSGTDGTALGTARDLARSAGHASTVQTINQCMHSNVFIDDAFNMWYGHVD